MKYFKYLLVLLTFVPTIAVAQPISEVDTGLPLGNGKYLPARGSVNGANLNKILRSTTSDNTELNAPTGKTIAFTINGSAEATVGDDTFTFSGNAPYINGVVSAGFQINSDPQRLLRFTGTSDTALGLTWGDAGTTAVQGLLIGASTADADDDYTLSLAGGGAAGITRGGYITLAGNETAGDGDVVISAGSDANSDVSLAAPGSSSKITATVSGTTDLLTLASSGNTALNMKFGDAGVTAVQQLLISASTADADDDSSLILAGGGADGGTRGASITLPGEEVAGGSDITYNAGTGDTHIFTVAGVTAATISTSALTLPTNILNVATNVETVAGAGTTVADAAALSGSKGFHQLTGANGTVGWKFPSATAGDVHFLLNTTAGVPKVYAVSGGTCNGGGADVACTLVTGIVAHMCYATAANAWICS